MSWTVTPGLWDTPTSPPCPHSLGRWATTWSHSSSDPVSNSRERGCPQLAVLICVSSHLTYFGLLSSGKGFRRSWTLGCDALGKMHQLQQGQLSSPWLQLSFPIVYIKLAINNSRNSGQAAAGSIPNRLQQHSLSLSGVPVTMCPCSLRIYSFSGHSSEPHTAVTGSTGVWTSAATSQTLLTQRHAREGDGQNLALICMFCPCNKTWEVSLKGDCILIAS